ncbi:MAG: glutaredoxin domain-containing protein [Chloroflexi bacterium]|nr:glutaredoxin domain-containing protein [Chloroflexota bacterium]
MQTEEFLSENGVKFDRRDVINDPTAMAELVKIGVMTTPVTVIDGQVVVGFDRGKLKDLLDC